MVEFDDLKVYLPKYLSDESLDDLLEDIKKFVLTGSNKDIYTTELENEKQVFQGDALKSMPFITFPFDTTPVECKVLVLSNSCDINPENSRPFDSHLMYAPISRLAAYIERLQASDLNEQKLINHISDIKSQSVTQILYLPQHENGPDQDCIVFLDRICHCDNSFVNLESLKERRLFSFSNYGFYLLLLKLSIHFTRIREKIDRDKGEILN
jgi:hypothetical protein